MESQYAAATETQGQRHPKALWFLSFAEAWERFSYYGMQGLLALYLTNHLLLEDRSNAIVGFADFRAVVEGIVGELSTLALATMIVGLYSSAVYLTPIFGGMIADRLLGRTKTIVIGALVMVAGHFLMAFEFSFLIALAAIAAGTGLFKGNIASQLGALYRENDPARSRAFQIFFLGIGLGALFAPLIVSTLGEKVAWHWGFGAAGVGMLIGLFIYLAGLRHLPREDAKIQHEDRPKITSSDWASFAKVLVLLPVLAVLVLPNQQLFVGYILWSEQAYDFNLFGYEMPVGWVLSIDSATSMICLAGSVAFWTWWGRRHKEPDDFLKIALAGGVTALAYGLLAILSLSGDKISLLWAIVFHTLNNLAFANMVPVGLSLFTRLSPASIGATAVGVYYLHLVIANSAVGYIGGFLDKMPTYQFWGIHVAIALAGVALILIAKAVLFATGIASENAKSGESLA